ncbi:MAG: FtsX-like permease family protein [Myxococcales bacterium]|nr:FtsX-like permease family protein [Myxococcales bacterium]
MKLFLISARNVLRNRGRTFLTVLGAAVAILAFIMLRTILSAWTVAAEYAAKDRIATRHKVTFVMQLPKRYIDTIRETPGVKKATWMNWFGARDPKRPDDFFANMAVDPKTFLEVYDEVVVADADKQRWYEDRQGAIIGANLAKKMGLKVGDKVTLEGSIYPGDWTFNVSGIYTATRKSFDDSQFLFHWNYLNDSLPERRRDEIGWVVSRVDDPGKGASISQAIDSVFDQRDTQTTTMSERAMNLSFLGMFSAILTALDIVSVIILAIMMMILGNTIAMGVRERTREFAVLRAIGFTPGHVRTFIIGEAAFFGVLSGVVGVLLAYPIVQQGMGRWLEENMGGFFPYFRIEPMTVALALGLSVALGIGASLLPAARAAKLPVTEALRRVA